MDAGVIGPSEAGIDGQHAAHMERLFLELKPISADLRPGDEQKAASKEKALHRCLPERGEHIGEI